MSSPKTPANAKSVAASLIAGLREAGVEVCFGIPGRHVQSMFHAMPAAGDAPPGMAPPRVRGSDVMGDMGGMEMSMRDPQEQITFSAEEIAERAYKI